MADSDRWRTYWEQRAEQSLPDYEYDRGRSPRGNEIELLSDQELLSFIQPEPGDTVFDAGCGSGVNIDRFHSRVRSIIAMDFSQGSVERARKRVRLCGIDNAKVIQGNVTEIPLPNRSVDKVLCMSVLQYLNDGDVRRAFAEFRRILRPQGVVILHVKNISSIYLATLYLMKKVKSLFRSGVQVEHYRSYRWYMRELESAGFKIAYYNSFNLLVLEGMPKSILQRLQKYELSNYNNWLMTRAFVRRHGSDLKVKAAVTHRVSECVEDNPSVV
jgi:ubiquinone/menaquinone biosynthesis C-methylase UbiE